MNSQQIRESVNEQLIAAMAQNVFPWRKPWSSGNGGRHRNFQTNRVYSGVNPWLLELHCMRHGFKTNRWMTFNQAKALGCSIKKRPATLLPGSWGCNVVFCRPVKKTMVDQDTGDEENKSFMVLKFFTVFNALEQAEGEVIDRLRREESEQPVIGPDYPTAQELLDNSGATIIHNNGDKAYYTRPTPEDKWPNHTDGDYIVLPERQRFESAEAYYETAFHELSHYSETRLGWDYRKMGYQAGELRAEITACQTASEIGLPLVNLQNHGAYLQHWLQAMKQSPSFIFSVCAAASRSTDFLLSFVHPVEDATSDENEESPLAVLA